MYCPTAIFFLSVAAGAFVQSTGGDRGRPSQRSRFHKEACLNSKEDQEAEADVGMF